MAQSHSKRKVIAFLFNSYDIEVENYKIGVLNYARPSRDWAFIHCSQNNIIRDLQRKDGLFDGGIGELGRGDLWRAALKCRFPVVNLYGGRSFRGLTTIGADDRAIGRMAARHLMEHGFTNFAYFGLPGIGFASGRWAGFYAELRAAGHRPLRFKYFKKYPKVRIRPLIHVHDELSIAGWLKSLPKPCGVFACDDMRAEWIATECLNLGIRIPDELSLIGTDDKEVHCLSSIPHLTSIRLPIRQIGFAAAQMMDQIFRGELRGTPPRILFPPEKVVARQSTDMLAVENPHLLNALKFIRANAHGGKISVDDVVAQTGYCRRILEMKFKDAFGRTIFQEIRHLQIEHAKRLLRDTFETMESIAESSGWGSASHFGIEFKKVTGLSPGEYRMKMRK